jgi:hypothetical protein
LAQFKARLSGREEVPPKITDATGTATLWVNDEQTQLHFRLVIRDIEKMIAAHIHVGQPGENGPIVAFLFGPSMHGISVERGVVEGTITRDNLVGPLEGQRLSVLIREMRNGNAYVNAHTEQNPEGETRGQIFKTHRC